jgi:hypothetical protein
VSTWPHPHLLQVADAAVELERAKVLDPCLADAWQRVREYGEDSEHCATGTIVYAAGLADKLAPLLGVSRSETQETILAVLLNDRRRIVLDCMADYLAMVRRTTGPTGEPPASGDRAGAAGDVPEPEAIRRARRQA